MLPYIHMLGHTIALYGLIISIGAFIGALIAIHLSRRTILNKEDVIFSFLYAMLGVIIGGKLLYWAIEFPNIWAKKSFYLAHPETIIHLFTGGFVFYGSFIGAVIALIIYTRKFKVPLEPLVYVFTPSIPIIHAIGRIGCFSAGCCYGIPYDGPLHVIFKNSTIAPSTIPLFPVQLLESGVNVLIFLLLLYLMKKIKNGFSFFGLYIVFYSIARFLLEFLRGDLDRGFLFLFSTSQWISIGLFLVGITLYYRNRKKY